MLLISLLILLLILLILLSTKLKSWINSYCGLDLFRGLRVTGRYFWQQKITSHYPDERIPRSPRFRGLHALRRYPNGEERCIACKLCEAVCPALAITIESAPQQDDSRRTTLYEIDLFKCVYCGLCEEACPVDAIVLTDYDEFHIQHRGENILAKDALLAIGDQYEHTIAKNRAIDSKEETSKRE